MTTFSERQADELRARMAAFAACYAQPLPAGDAGLVEAWRRYVDVYERFEGEGLGSGVDGLEITISDDIIAERMDPLCEELTAFIEVTEARTIAGALAKLRLLFERHNVDEEPSALPLLALIERAAAKAGILDRPARKADRAAA